MNAEIRALREKIGDDAMAGLQALVDDAGRQWKDDVLSIAAERFERRLAQEIGALRVDMAKEFAAVRVEMANGFAAVRAEMATEFAAVRVELSAVRVEFAGMRASLLTWCFVFWIGQVAAVGGMMAFLLRTMGAR